ncbi:MAG: hypothetical protein H7Y32_18845 [Chloroflexales bacterium]|nr:hypothetical protein [Chloroflexales bacterium]
MATQPTTRIHEAAPARSRRWLVAAALGGTAAIGLVAAALAWRGPQPPPTAAAPTAVAALAPTAAPTFPPTSLPTLVPSLEPTAPPAATAALIALPTVPPTAAPPTAVPTLLPSPVLEEGNLRIEDSFENGVGWARSQQQDWSVGYADSAVGAGTVYQITAEPGVGNIWSYRTAPGSADYSVGVDVLLVEPGSAGLLLRFQDRSNYLVCLLDPAARTFRVEQRRNGDLRIIAEGTLGRAVDATTATRLVTHISGSSLTLVVDGEVVLEERVAGLPDTPLYGLVAVAGAQRVVAQFDNLELRDIEPGS